jgi:hypothetical protein
MAAALIRAELPDPLVHYTFEDVTTGTIVINKGTLGASHDLKLENGAKFGDSTTGPFAPGTPGQTLDLTSSVMNGAGGVANLYSGNKEDHTGLESMTVTGWFNPSVTPIDGARLVRVLGTSSGYSGYHIRFTGARRLTLRVAKEGGSSADTSSSYNSETNAFSASPGEWQFFAVSWNKDSGAKWYAATTAQAPGLAGQDATPGEMGRLSQILRLGAEATTGNAFQGYLDDFRIYNSVLTEEQITEVYQSNGGDPNVGLLPYPPAWENDSDERRAKARQTYLALVDRIIKDNSSLLSLLQDAETNHTSLGRYVIYYCYAQIYRASLVPASAVTGSSAVTRASYIENGRRVLNVLATAIADSGQRARQAEQLMFAQGSVIRLYKLLVEMEALTPEQQTALKPALGDCAQSVLDLKAEYGSFNRAACDAMGLAATARLLEGEDSRTSDWLAFEAAVWNDWKHVTDTFEDARGYNGLWLYATLRQAEEMGRLGELNDDAVKTLFGRFSHIVAHNGTMPDYGGSAWAHAYEMWIPAFERLGHLYQRVDFLENALRCAEFVTRNTGMALQQMEGLVEACRAIEATPADTSITRPDAIVTTRTGDFGDVLFDKLHLRTGNAQDSAYASFNLLDQGYHGRAGGGSLSLYTTGSSVLLHTLGGRAFFANQQQGAWAAPDTDGFLQVSPQHKADEWTRWLVNFRWPGTYVGGPVLDPSSITSLFFRLADPAGFDGTVTVDVESVTGVKSSGETQLVQGAWSGSKTFSAATTGESAFIRPGPVTLDLTPYQYLLVKWKSSLPDAAHYFGFDGASFLPGAPKPANATLRTRASSHTLSASIVDDAAAPGGSFERIMLDSTGRLIKHARDARLRKSDGALLVLDTFTFTEAGHYTVGAIWHAQNIVEEGEAHLVARDDAQYDYNGSKTAEPPSPVRFDFASSQGGIDILKTSYKLVHPQKEHFAATCSGAREVDEVVSILSVLRPGSPASAPSQMNIGAHYAIYADAQGTLALGAVPNTTITGFSPQTLTRGASVEISGVNFVNVTEVRIGGVTVPAAGYTVDSATKITIHEIPAAIPDTGYIQVFTQDFPTASSSGMYGIAIGIGGLPTLENRGVTQGRNLTFHASVIAGNPPPTYQWQVLSTEPGAEWQDITADAPYSLNEDGSMLTINGATAALNDYQYRFIASNFLSSATSNAAAVSIEKMLFPHPAALALDGTGNIYVVDDRDNTLTQITGGTATAILGGSPGRAGVANGHGSHTLFNKPSGLTIGVDGNLYVADAGNAVIRQTTPGGVTSMFAGSSINKDHQDGTGGGAWFNFPSGICSDVDGNLYISDSYNHVIRRITPLGGVSTVAGTAKISGTADGAAASASFTNPTGIAVVQKNARTIIYVADTGNHTIRIIDSGSVGTLAGSAGEEGYAEGSGAAARFRYPGGLVADGDDLYLADTGNHIIREINTLTGNVQTVAGLPTIAGRADGNPLEAMFDSPLDVAIDSAGNLYVADSGNAAIRKIDVADTVSSVVASATAALPPPPPDPGPWQPSGAADNHGGGMPSAWFLLVLVIVGGLRAYGRM